MSLDRVGSESFQDLAAAVEQGQTSPAVLNPFFDAYLEQLPDPKLRLAAASRITRCVHATGAYYQCEGVVPTDVTDGVEGITYPPEA